MWRNLGFWILKSIFYPKGDGGKMNVPQSLHGINLQQRTGGIPHCLGERREIGGTWIELRTLKLMKQPKVNPRLVKIQQV